MKRPTLITCKVHHDTRTPSSRPTNLPNKANTLSIGQSEMSTAMQGASVRMTSQNQIKTSNGMWMSAVKTLKMKINIKIYSNRKEGNQPLRS